MSIQPVKGLRGQEMALCKCDQCCAETSFAAAHGHNKGQRRGGAPVLTLAKLGQVHDKLQADGWSLIKNRLLCAKCETARKAAPAPQPIIETPIHEVAAMPTPEPKSNVAPIRQPTAEQEVDIIVTLSSVYDRKQKRYQGNETDKTVAETVGGGVMPGWVAAIREAKFGPAGNEEVTLIRAEIAKLKADTERALAALTKRLDACVAAHDRRVG